MSMSVSEIYGAYLALIKMHTHRSYILQDKCFHEVVYKNTVCFYLKLFPILQEALKAKTGP